MKKTYGKRTDYPIEKLLPDAVSEADFRAVGQDKRRNFGEGVYRISEFGMVNCYLVVGSERALLVDAATGCGDLKSALKRITDLPVDVVFTHAHVDHWGGMGQFGKVYVYKDDDCTINRFQTSVLCRKMMVAVQKDSKRQYGISARDVKKRTVKPEIVDVDENFVFDLGNRTVSIKHIPGHTLGSVALIDDVDKAIFVGDNACPYVWMFLPHASSVEEWIPSGKWMLSKCGEYSLFWGHLDGRVDAETVERLIVIAEELVNESRKSFPSIKLYPKHSDGKGCFVYRSRNVLDKSRKKSAKQEKTV